MAFFDIALRFNTVTRRCDIAIAGGDLAIDRTPATPLLVSFGSDARALPDDVVPDVYSDTAQMFNARRGYPGDALDRQGRRTGSRMWLLQDRKQTEDTRLLAISYAQGCSQWIEDDHGLPVQCSAAWVRRGLLGVTAVVGSAQITVPVTVT